MDRSYADSLLSLQACVKSIGLLLESLAEDLRLHWNNNKLNATNATRHQTQHAISQPSIYECHCKRLLESGVNKTRTAQFFYGIWSPIQ